MVAIRPQTDIILLKVPLQLNQEHQLNFANATAQFNYFNSLPKLTEYNATYQRKDNTIRYGANFEDLVGYNYVMYRNEPYGNKWFYAFIDNMEYINDNMTALSIRTDVYQTWQFDITMQRTFVEREHTNDDSVGSNVVPEDLEKGDYVYNGASVTLNNQGGFLLCLQLSTIVSPLELPAESTPTIYNNTFHGLAIIGLNTSDNGYVNLYKIKKHLANNGYEEGIVSIFYAPSDLLTVTKQVTIDNTNMTIYYPEKSYFGKLLDSKTLTRPAYLDGYTPRNNKLHTYPFQYIFATNHTGGEAEYRWEDFANTGSASFSYYGTLGQGANSKMYPANYKGMQTAYDYGIAGQKLPVCSWATDYYLNYMAQNGFNMTSRIGSSMFNVGSIMGGGLAGAIGGVASIFGTITGVMGEVTQAYKTPNQAHGDTNNADINFAMSETGVTIRNMSIKAQFARQIDDYFSMFGYATRRVKMPNITGRRNWNYVKTIGCYLRSDAPQADIQELEQMFNNGITIWHNPATFMDYSQANPIV